ncbi:glucokinase [Endozoicomonas ascidiicola]|uniref:glucokinase n=1 Tax=Endozoicomonas ascidiicola TaxID=1698521 RepID=UPI00082C4370|nr:glucokinase [Endozoicomonas ascidiicola]
MPANIVSQNTTALVADIGGTNARFALAQNGQIIEESIRVLPCGDYSNLDQAVADYLANQKTVVVQACMAFACPVNSPRIKMTNNHWTFDKSEMKALLELETFKVINDFTAQALALPALPDSALVKIGSGKAIEGTAKLIIGPGTGLGVAGLKQVGSHWLPLPGEGGHAAFSPVTPLDSDILAIIQQKMDYVSWETVLCGSGLELLFEAHSILASNPMTLKNHEITTRALEGEPMCKQALEHFCSLLGRAASNSALALGAQGGVYIAGGIIPRFPQFFAKSGFRSSFEVNDKMTGYLEGTPTSLIMHDYPGLLGAANALKNPLV